MEDKKPTTPETSDTPNVVSGGADSVTASGNTDSTEVLVSTSTSLESTAADTQNIAVADKVPVTPVTVEASREATPSATTVETNKSDTKANTDSRVVWQGYAIAAMVIVLLSAGVWYVLERDGRVTTSVFTSIVDGIRDTSGRPALRINDTIVTNERLQVAINQLSQSAEQQGADLTSPEVQTLIREQATEMMINTELLLQAAAAEEITVTDEQVDARISEIEMQVGGAEQLVSELTTASVSMEELRNDIVTEITIQALLTALVAAQEITATDEEISGLYEAAGGEAAGNPPLNEIREQVAGEVRSQKEQQLVQDYVESLRLNTEIEELE